MTERSEITIESLEEAANMLRKHKDDYGAKSFTKSFIDSLEGEEKKRLQEKVEKLGPILEIYISSDIDIKAFEGVKDMVKITQHHLLPSGSVLFSWFDSDSWKNDMKLPQFVVPAIEKCRFNKAY